MGIRMGYDKRRTWSGSCIPLDSLFLYRLSQQSGAHYQFRVFQIRFYNSYNTIIVSRSATMWITDTCKAIVLSFVAVFHSPTLPSDGPHQDVLSFTHSKPTPKYPHFPAPNGPDKDGVEFHCKYPELKGWENCTSADDRSCWLKGPYGQVFNIDTDYENFYPEGIVREVSGVSGLEEWA